MNGYDRLLPSPCIGICQLDVATGWCLGCGRTRDELDGWRDLPMSAQETIWARLPERLTRLQRSMRVLPWSPRALLERLAVLSSLPGTVWSLGVVGASAELLASDDAELTVALGDDELFVRHPRGGLRVRAIAGLRGFVQHGATGAEIALAVHGSRVKTTTADTVTDLGPDAGALAGRDRSQRLFDLGLGCEGGIRFCVRTADPALVDALVAEIGRPLFATDLPERLLQASPPRVLLSPVGRLEVTAPIAPPGGRTPSGPHTHLFPEQLRNGSARHLGGVAPEGYVPVALIFAPSSAFTAAELDLEGRLPAA